MKKFPLAFIKPVHLFLLVAVLPLSANICDLNAKLKAMRNIRAKIPYIFMGYKFAGLNEILKDVTIIGYFTDKSLDDRQSALQFAQAQYMLAPIILDFNQTGHEFILFDCSRPEIAYEKIKKLGAVPLRKNRFGIILAKNHKSKTGRVPRR